MWVFWGFGLPLTGGVFFLPLLNVAGSYADNRGGWGWSCPLLVRCLSFVSWCCGKSCHSVRCWGYGGGGGVPPLCVLLLFSLFSSSSFVSCVLGEVVGVVGAISCQFTTVLYICGMKIISVTNYAKSIGVTRQAIIKRIKMNNPLPGVKSYYKTGGKTSHYILILE